MLDKFKNVSLCFTVYPNGTLFCSEFIDLTSFTIANNNLISLDKLEKY